MTLILRLMTPGDIPQVVAIDQQAFSTPWSARTYAYEVSESQNSHMLVVDYQPDAPGSNGQSNGQHRSDRNDRVGNGLNQVEQTIPQRRLPHQEHAERHTERRAAIPNQPHPRGWWQRLRPLTPPPQTHQLVSYGGLWRMLDEAHISTIASHPEYRGQGYGEIALVAMMRRSAQIGAGYIVLEVRVSNTVAQNLYRKHGFKLHATKTRYYRDNNEDAFDMRLELSPAARREIEQRFEALRQRHHLIDGYTQTSPPNR